MSSDCASRAAKDFYSQQLLSCLEKMNLGSDLVVIIYEEVRAKSVGISLAGKGTETIIDDWFASLELELTSIWTQVMKLMSILEE